MSSEQIENQPECLECDGHCCQRMWFNVKDILADYGVEITTIEQAQQFILEHPAAEPLYLIHIERDKFGRIEFLICECSWYNPVTGGCRHYEDRPQWCREYPLSVGTGLVPKENCPLLDRLQREAAAPGQ